jgi:hypothetical protein
VTPHRDFFDATAQLIPLMAITLLVGQKLFLAPSSGHAPQTATERRSYQRLLLMVTGGLILTVVGEAAALVAIAFTPNAVEAILVVTALIALALLLVVPFVRLMAKTFPVPADSNSRIHRVSRRALPLVPAIASCVVGIGLFVILAIYH